MSGKKYFVLMENGEDTSQVFVNSQPRGAALKAARRGHTNIDLRERGTNRVHCFEGWRTLEAPGAGAPDYLPEKIWKANVKKNGIKRL
ncbi:MAG: non-histone chromosomal MC1 family protein [Candidatus Thalassarchaeaceae archaeon]|nr:non-histone chromosomal MC1 family protein [Candidatus Thalassarchaeaceae archaeon]